MQYAIEKFSIINSTCQTTINPSTEVIQVKFKFWLYILKYEKQNN